MILSIDKNTVFIPSVKTKLLLLAKEVYCVTIKTKLSLKTLRP